MRYTLIFALSVSILLSGCSEKPERKATREVRKSSQKARNIISDSRDEARRIIREGDREAYDAFNAGNPAKAAQISQTQHKKAQDLISKSFDQALSEIEGSLRNARNSNAANPALLTTGNILFSQALHLRSKLGTASSPIDSFIDNMHKKVLRMSDLDTTKLHRQKLIEANKIEVDQLKDILERGTENHPGLKTKLRNEEDKLVEIEKQIKALKAIAKKAADQANQLEKSAMEKFRAADALSGDEKLAMKNKAFDLRLAKKKFSMEMQTANDKIAILDSRAQIIAPVIETIINDINSVEDKIKKIIEADGNAKLQTDIEKIEKQYNAHADSISKNVQNTENALDYYLSRCDKILDQLDQAIEKYEKVRSRPGNQIARNRKAACYFWKAGVNAESARTHKNLMFRIKPVIAAAVDRTISDKLETLENRAAKTGSEHAFEALKNYDLAAKEYEDVSTGSQSQFDCAVCKSHILTLYSKMVLAEYLGNTSADKSKQTEFYSLSNSASLAIEKLVEKAKKCDPAFGDSPTGRLWSGEIDWTPEMHVDQAEHYEELRKNFQAWNKLKGEEKEKEVKRLILKLENMAPGKDPEAFDRILMPELIQLKSALEKGFKEDTNANTNSFGQDPNY